MPLRHMAKKVSGKKRWYISISGWVCDISNAGKILDILRTGYQDVSIYISREKIESDQRYVAEKYVLSISLIMFIITRRQLCIKS